MKRFLPYLVPLLSILFLLFYLAFSKPAVTGMAALPEVSARISLSTSEKDFLPENATISLYFANQEATMTVKDFIFKSKQEYRYIEGNNTILNYKGKGFSGNYTYHLPLEEFDLNRSVKPGKYDLSVRVVYSNIILSEKFEEVSIE